jgi:hypothetical protein
MLAEEKINYPHVNDQELEEHCPSQEQYQKVKVSGTLALKM